MLFQYVKDTSDYIGKEKNMTYRILLENKPGKEILKEVREEHKDDIEGVGDLYDSLVEEGVCESNIPSRIYYVAYTLALKDIEIMIVNLDKF